MADAVRAERPQHAHYIGLLTFTSGCVDVVTLMMIGGAFTSVITGNLIFVGRAIGTTSLTPAVHAILAIIGYIVGVAAGSRLRLSFGRDRPAQCASSIRTATAVISARSSPAAASTAWTRWSGSFSWRTRRRWRPWWSSR